VERAGGTLSGGLGAQPPGADYFTIYKWSKISNIAIETYCIATWFYVLCNMHSYGIKVILFPLVKT